MFSNIDTDGSGTITYEELKTGLSRLGSKLTESEIKQLMEAVRFCNLLIFLRSIYVQSKLKQKPASYKKVKFFLQIIPLSG